jgi:hypothetical protein
LILVFINVIYNAASTVAYLIRKAEKNKDVLVLQDSLGVIQDVIKNLAHHTILSLLKNSVDPLDAHQTRNSKNETRQNVKKYLTRMYENASILTKYEYEYPPLQVMHKSEAYEGFQKECLAFQKWIDNPLESKITQKGVYDSLGTAFIKLLNENKDNIISVWEYQYTEKYLKGLANLLIFHSLIVDLNRRVLWTGVPVVQAQKTQ